MELKVDYSLISQVKSAQTYQDLPHRLIINSPFCEKPLVSYGVIAYCQETNRWLLVKRRHSPEEITMMRGSYRNSEIPRLLKGKSKEELDRDRSSLQDESHFRNRFISTIGSSIKDLHYALIRFNEAKHIIQDHIITTEGESTTGWLFPKGRLYTIYETPHRCALREFHEDTGISISPKGSSPYETHLVSTKPLIETFRAVNGRIYETRCWVYVFNKEITPPPIIDLDTPGEIGDRRWVSEVEAFNLLSPGKYQLLQSARKLINFHDQSKSQSLHNEESRLLQQQV